jgi:F420-non-reducing hydrogenase large subunit
VPWSINRRARRDLCVGRPVEEMALLTNRICGVCPEAHHMAAAKAADAVYNVTIPRTAKMLRELLYSAFFVTDHTTHFYILAGPDFIMGPEAPVAERNILGVKGDDIALLEDNAIPGTLRTIP